MKRTAVLTLGISALLLAGLAVGTGGVRAGEKDEDEHKKVEKRIEVIRLGGGGSFLGVSLQEIEGDARGAEVQTVEPDSAAEKAGVEDGDVIVRFDGVDVRSASQLVRLVRETPAGRVVEIEVKRGGTSRTLTATLGEGRHRHHAGAGPHGLHVGPGGVFVPELPEMGDFDVEIAPELHHGAEPHVFRWHSDGDNDFTMAWVAERPRLGIRFMEIGDQLAEYFGLADDDGVLVTAVEPDTPAARAGIQAGDVVLELGGEAIRSGSQLRKQVRKAASGEPVAMKLQRKGAALDVEVTLPEPEKPKKAHSQTGVSL